MSAIYGRAIIDTLHERVGEEELLRSRDDLETGGKGMSGAWLRYIGHDGKRDGDRIGLYGEKGPAFDYRFDALQIGLDLYRNIDAEDDSREHAGAFLAYGKGKGNVRHTNLEIDFHAGDDRFDARTIGGYWTGFNASGAYLDAVAQYTWYDLRSRSYRLPDNFTNGRGLALSLEGGHPYVLDEEEDRAPDDPIWRLEPQAQVVYQQMSFDDIRDDIAHVRFRDADSLAARLGLRVNRESERRNASDEPRTGNAWLRANIWHEFKGKPRSEFETSSGYVPFQVDLGGSWAELGIGGTWQVSRTGYFYADIDYSWSFNGQDTSWNGKAGMRWNW